MTPVRRWTGREAHALREALRMSVRGFATYLGVGVRTVASWDAAGVAIVPRPEMQAALDTALAQADDETRTRLQLLLADSSVRLDAHGTSDPASQDASLPGDVEAIMLRWLLVGSGGAVDPHRPVSRRVGTADIERLRSVRRHLKALDNAYGGRTAYPMAVVFLRREVAPLIAGRYDEPTGRELFAATAELTLDLGWMAYDSGDHLLARAYMGHSLSLSRMAGERLFGGRVLAAMSHQALHIGEISLAIECARAGRAGIEQVGSPRAVAMVASMEAMAHAAGDDRAACLVAVRDAEKALDRADTAADPDWLDFDEGGLWGHAARAYRLLGIGAECERFAEQSIATCQPSHSRTRAQRYAILAAAHVQQREMEEAAAVGERVIGEAWNLNSRHVDEEIAGLAAVIRQRAPASGRDFLVHANEYLTARAI